MGGRRQSGVAGTVLGNRDQRVRLGDYVVAGFERPANAACLTIEVCSRRGLAAKGRTCGRDAARG